MTNARDAHEVILDYAAGRWRAHGAGIELAHRELTALDGLIVAALGARGAERVHVRFDTDCLPAWLRQHHAHYCNYVLVIEPPATAAARLPA